LRYIPTALLRPGYVLARTVYGDAGDILLAKGISLTQGMISALLKRDVKAVWIKDGVADDVEPENAVSDHIHAIAVNSVHQIFQTVSQEGARRVSRDSIDRLRRVAESIVDEVLDSNISSQIVSLKTHDAYTFAHSVDVAVGSVIIGKHLNMDRASLRELALGALLHDIGKVQVAREILVKPGPLTEEEWKVVRLHPVWGYEIISTMPVDEILPRHIALQHHERQDGQGYPRGLRGLNRIAREDRERFSGNYIMLAAEIVQVADVHSALASDRPHRPAFRPEEIPRALREMSGSHLNRELVDVFLAFTPVFPCGLTVRITGGPWDDHYAVVVRNHDGAPDRPTVRVVMDPRGYSVHPVEIDLRKEAGVAIRSALIAPQPVPI